MSKKLSAVLAKTDHLASSFKKNITEYVKFFKSNQSQFLGERKTYTPRPGQMDIPGERALTLVQTTVDEKLKYLEDNVAEYIDLLFSQERTNASGLASANLVVDGVVWGSYSSLELLRLKSFIENNELTQMYENLPVRSDSIIWSKNDQEMYQGREIYQTELTSGIRKTTNKESYILPDPNLAQLKDTSRYTPVTSTRDTLIELGDFTFQKFSGESTQLQKAKILQRRTKLLAAVILALKEANDVELVESEMTSKKLFGYLHNGSI